MPTMSPPPLPAQPVRPRLEEKFVAHKDGALIRKPNESVVILDHLPAMKNGAADYKSAAEQLGVQLLATEDQVNAFHRALLEAVDREKNLQRKLNDQLGWRVKVEGLLDSWWGYFLLPRALKPLL